MRWKWILQQTCGGVRRMQGAKARVVDAARCDRTCRLGITSEDVQNLLSGQAPLLVYRGALPEETCRRAAHRFRALAGAGGEAVASGAGVATSFSEWRLGADSEAPASDYAKLGYTKTDVMIQEGGKEGLRMRADSPAPESYLKRAAETRHFLDSEIFAPDRNPIDDIRDELSTLPGIMCRLERCPSTRKEFLPCVVRSMSTGGRHKEGNVHMDTPVPARTMSINVYLSVPDEVVTGGELVLYPTQKDALSRFLNAHFFETIEVQNFFPDRTFYTQQILDTMEPIVYRPRAGDVVLIDPAYPHAVRDFATPSDFRRISLQTFVQVSGAESWVNGGGPLRLEYAV